MGDVRKDVEALRRVHATGNDKLEYMSDITNLVITIFEERIKKENPKLSKKEILKILREELYHGRKDTP
ncbi:hypothetical protein HY988_05645 [Candidatus Micrarchaeota archaeon]|nr:hypothetical protein [Candidatus Micrarchaeota archaeon]